MNLIPRILPTITFLLLTVSAARAGIMVGDRAPGLQTGQWIQGEPVSGFDNQHIYVVEFWATWCGPCIQSIPHLNALWNEFKDKDVIFIGQDVWDSDQAVAPFVKKMGTNMTYRVALDDKTTDPDGWMADNWWKRKVNNHGIPTAFIINRDGVIAWIGHPMTLNKDILGNIVSGRYDIAKAAADYKKDLAMENQLSDLQQEIFSSIKQKKWDDAQSAFNKIDALLPNMANNFAVERLEVLLGQRKFGAAASLADSAGKLHPLNDNWQNNLAWAIACAGNPDARCLAVGETLAGRAVKISHETNSSQLDTLARVQFMQGKKEAAIATEEKAASLEQNEGKKSALNATLASYRRGNLPKADE